MEVPEAVKAAKRDQGWSVAAILGAQFAGLAVMLVGIGLTEGSDLFPYALFGGLAVMVLAVLGAVYARQVQMREATDVIKAWDHLRSQAKAAELEAELATPDTMHPLVDQIRQRQAALGPEATALGKRLLQLDRERASVQQTLDALPEGPTREELQASLTTVEREHADTLDALARLYTAAMSGQHADPALAGLVSEVPLPTEPPAEAIPEARGERQASRERS